MSNANLRTENVSALLVGDFASDRHLIDDLFRQPGWLLAEAQDRPQALDLLAQRSIHVVIANSDLASWNWRHVLTDLDALPNPPQLIVTSRTADEYLWSEVLHIGAFDVLPQPLSRDETVRVIAAARRHFDSRSQVADKAS